MSRASTLAKAVGANGDISVSGNTTIGDASTDTVTFNAATASIPNNLAFTGGEVGIGIAPSANWASNHAALQFGSTGASYASLSQQTTVNCAASLSWNATATTGDEVWAYRGSGNFASRYRQFGSGFQFMSSGVNTANAGDAITWYTGLVYNQTAASATGAKIGINVTAPNVALQVLGPTLSSNATQSQYALGVGNGSGYDLTLGTDSSYAYVQSWASKPLYLLPQGNNMFVGAGNTVFGGTTAYTKLQLNGGDNVGFTLYSTDNASGSYNTAYIAHRFNYTGTSQTDGARITFTRPSNVDGNYGDELYFSTRPNGGSLVEAVRVDQSQRMLQKAGRKSNAYTMGNCQQWVGTVSSIANNGTFSLFTINGQYDNLCYELDVFVNAGGYFAVKQAGVFGYNGFVNTILGSSTAGFTISKTGTLYNETMTITNSQGATVNAYYISLRVWGYHVSNSVSTGGTDLITSSYLTRIE
jgi:hypothetical protein